MRASALSAKATECSLRCRDKTLKIANRELGTIENADGRGNVENKLDSDREVRFNLEENRHLDYGYAVTSHSSQGATADRVLVNLDTEEAHEKLINSRLAYVAVYRARYDAQMYTNDASNLGRALGREVSHAAAFECDGTGKPNGAEIREPQRRRERSRPRSREKPRVRHGDGRLKRPRGCSCVIPGSMIERL